MMEEKDREVTEMKELVIQRQDKMELLLKQMVKGAGSQYKLCSDDIRTAVPSDEAEVHTALDCQ